jgi:hypothetical protein
MIDIINKCIQQLKDLGVSQEVIDRCFVLEETESELEIKGSVYMALQESGLYDSFIDCVYTGDNILRSVFNDILEDIRVKDYSKKVDIEEVVEG